MPQMAYAQEASASDAASTQANDDATDATDNKKATKKKQAVESKEGDIVVIGSRIRRGTKNASQNVQTLTPEQSRRQGLSGAREALQDIGVTGGSDQVTSILNGVIINGGPGVASISLRRMGPARTLVLLNGRRLAPAGVGGSVSTADLNTLPSPMIAQTNILKDGASSIYGSDAIAGVIDAVTRKRVEGMEAEAFARIGQEGGGELYDVSSVGGFSGDRFNFVWGASYTIQRELEWGDRERYLCPTTYRIDPTALNPVPGSGDEIDPLTGKRRCWGAGSGGFQQNILSTGLIPGVSHDGTRFNYWLWRANPSVMVGIPGMEGVSTAAQLPGGAAIREKYRNRVDYFNPDMLGMSVQGQSKVWVGMAGLTYDLQTLGDAEFYVDMLGVKRHYWYDYSTNDVINYVAGSPLVPAAWSFAIGMDGPDQLTKGKSIAATALIYSGLKRNKTEVDFLRSAAGLRGEFFVPGWRYDFTHTWSRSHAKRQSPVRLTSRLIESMDVILINNVPVCASEKARAEGCVAIPAFSPAIFAPGGLPKAWLNYVYSTSHEETTYTDNSLYFDLNGPLIALPYGELKAAMGVEARFFKINNLPDKESQAGNYFNQSAAAITQGSSRALEAYGELEVPILANLPFAKALTLNASARVSKDKQYEYNTTYKAGLSYSPDSWISLRASMGTGYRAPALYERFLGDTSGFVNARGTDPCDNWDQLEKGGNVYNNCLAEGLPEGFRSSGSLTVITRGGKSTQLKAETAKNIAFGLTIQPELPEAVGNMSFSADYYHVKINGGIAKISAGAALSLCYDDPKFRNGGRWCPLVGARDPNTKQLTTLRSEYLNTSQQLSEGMEFAFNYTRDIGLGTYALSARAYYTMKDRSRLFAKDPYDEDAGELGSPRYTGQLSHSYTYKRWNVSFATNWVDAMNNITTFNLTPATLEALKTFVYYTDDYYLHSLSVSYRADTWNMTVGVRNITNAMPPRVSADMGVSRLGDMLYYGGAYDTFGRSFNMTFSKKF